MTVSFVGGGVITNLFFTVFESCIVTEHCHHRSPKEQLEKNTRDSMVASNLSVIFFGCLEHVCTSLYRPTGPFSGNFACTFVALFLVITRWEENYGSYVPSMKIITPYLGKSRG